MVAGIKCRQNTHSHDTFVHVQLITARTAQRQSLISRTCVAQIVCLGVSKVVCRPSVMSHMLLHFSQSTSTRSLSLVFRPSSPSLSCPSELEQEAHRDPRRSGGYTKICISHIVHDGIKEALQRPVWQSFMRSQDCSKAGEKETRWQHSGMKSKNWRRSWNKEGWKEAPGSRWSRKKYRI